MNPLRLTYEQLGERLGIDPAAARMRAKRRRWPMERTNDGRAVVLVPPDELEREPPPRLDGLDRLTERVNELDERLAAELAALRVELAAAADHGDRLDALERAVATLGEARHAQRELIKQRREEVRTLHRDLQAVAKQVDELRRPWWQRVLGWPAPQPRPKVRKTTAKAGGKPARMEHGDAGGGGAEGD
jgi:uncharacterized protein YhaN